MAELTEDGRVLLDRVTDRSWLVGDLRECGPPPEYGPALFGIDAAVQQALAADFSPDEIVNEVKELLSHRSEAHP